MQAYGTKDITRLAGVSESVVRSMVRAGYVRPGRGQRGTLRFSFQDLVLIKAARRLADARVPARRIGAALRALRAQLPDSAPLAALSITTYGDRIVVTERGTARDARTGQYVLALEISAREARVRVLENPRPQPAETDCDALFQHALTLEDVDVDAAMAAYRHCVEEHGHGGACANLGRLLHEQGRLEEAVELYRRMAHRDAVLLYNWAVALEDLGQIDEAMATYRDALRQDPQLADAHFNLARLLERASQRREALRHWMAYRRLVRT